MRAVRLHRLGGTPQVDTVAVPRRRPGETLVSVAAAALNPADLMMARGSFPDRLPPLPFVVGLEGAGRIVESDAYPAGTPVWWQALGTAAEYAIAPDDRIVPL